MALGAQPGGIQRMVLAESMHIAAWEILIGLIMLGGAGWSIRAWLLGVRPLNPFVYVVSAAAVLVLRLIAACLPALRATHVDPMAALRSD